MNFDVGDLVFWNDRQWHVHKYNDAVHIVSDSRIGGTLPAGDLRTDPVKLVRPVRWRPGDVLEHPNGTRATVIGVDADGWAHLEVTWALPPERSCWRLVSRPGVEVYPSSLRDLRALDLGFGKPATCDECRGRGFVELFLGPQPCSRGCK